MKIVNCLFIIGLVFSISGCAHLERGHNSGSVLQGTDTAVVGLYIDSKGYPKSKVDTITLHPGQRVVFVGPSQFDIFFKDKISPNGNVENKSDNGVVVIDIPKDVFERSARNNVAVVAPITKELVYRYGIRANGKVTDPIIVITPEAQ